MDEFFALLATFTLIGLSGFQFALSQGAPLGRFAWGGQYIVLPRKLKIASAASIFLYFIFILIILQESGLINFINKDISSVGIWVITSYLLVGIFMNAISRSRPERYLMTPLTVQLFISFFIVAA